MSFTKILTSHFFNLHLISQMARRLKDFWANSQVTKVLQISTDFAVEWVLNIHQYLIKSILFNILVKYSFLIRQIT